MIFDTPPGDWQELQEYVCRTFRELGWQADTAQALKLARGGVVLDVLAIDRTSTPERRIICERKYWARKVPKTVVHAFRTVVQDSGSDTGLLISKKGFQVGATEAAANSPVRLWSWEEFQMHYEEPWTRAICATLEQKLQVLLAYLRHEVADPTRGSDSISWHIAYRDLYDRSSWLRTIWPGTEAIMRGEIPRCFEDPVDMTHAKWANFRQISDFKQIKWISVSSKREFFDLILRLADQYVREFAELAGPLRRGDRIKNASGA